MDKDTIMHLYGAIPNHFIPAFYYWVEGRNKNQIKEALGRGERTKAGDSRYYRAARYLREQHSIDLNTRRSDVPVWKPKPKSPPVLYRVLCPQPENTPPEWFYEEGLMYEPSDSFLHAVK